METKNTVKRSVDELAADYGFGVEHTGGGCTALSKDIDGQPGQELYALITEVDEPCTPSSADTFCAMSVFDRASENCEPLVSFECPDLEFAMRLADMART